jgi:hypothetical protein
MSAGGFGPDQEPSGPYPQAGWPPPPRYDQPGQYGQPVSPQFRRDYAPQVPVPRRTNSLAIASLACGIGSFVVWPLTSIPAMVLGIMSLKRIRETGEDGHDMAVIGIVLGAICTVLFMLGVAAFIGFADFAWHQVHQFGNNG